MGGKFHVACGDCKCLVPLPDLSTGGTSDLSASRGRFGPEEVRVLERGLGADSALLTQEPDIDAELRFDRFA